MNSENLNNRQSIIIIFTRFPVPGETKTRLIPKLGPEGAALLQKKMTEFILHQVQQTGIPYQVRYTGGTRLQMQQWLGVDSEYILQGDGNLGDRLDCAVREAFERGVKKVVTIGADCPDNRSESMLLALSLLDTTSCVIGPAVDGGYYLIALNEPQPELFRGISWGTNKVLKQTISRISDYQFLPSLCDVDEFQDIPTKISVIIPALNEAGSIDQTIQSARVGFNIEIIVVDGGSDDNSRQLAEQAGAIVVESEPGRAIQMNAGAARATGDILLFLHADSQLPKNWDQDVRRMMCDLKVYLGYFRFAVDNSFRGSRWLQWSVNFRSQWFNRPYGDQGLFMRCSDFDSVGGFPDVPILEDVLLVRKALKMGSLRCTGSKVLTSGRRWKKHGVVRTTWINQTVLLAAWLGADLDKLSQFYRQGKTPFRIF